VTADARNCSAVRSRPTIICGATTRDSVEPRLDVKAKKFQALGEATTGGEAPL